MFASENKTLNAVRDLLSISSFYKASKPLFLIFSGSAPAYRKIYVILFAVHGGPWSFQIYPA